MNGDLYSLTSLKPIVKYLLENSFFEVGSQIFQLVIGIPMGSDPALLLTNLFLFH